MPTYDYACGSCGRSFEITHGIHAQRPTVCEVCGGTLRKQVSVPSIVFKGSGWAKVDSQAGVRAKADKDSGPADSATSTGGQAGPAPTVAPAATASTPSGTPEGATPKSVGKPSGTKAGTPKAPAAPAATSDSGRT